MSQQIKNATHLRTLSYLKEEDQTENQGWGNSYWNETGKEAEKNITKQDKQNKEVKKMLKSKTIQLDSNDTLLENNKDFPLILWSLH